jgi:hypothetical protein
MVGLECMPQATCAWCGLRWTGGSPQWRTAFNLSLVVRIETMGA